MSRRRRKSDGAGTGLLILIGGGILGASWVIGVIKDNLEITYGLAVIVVVVVLLVIVGKRFERARDAKELRLELERRESLRLLAARQRREMLLAKYSDEAVVEAIIDGGIWHDMTREQLLDSWGSPIAIDTKVLKRKVKETYKYDQTGVNRFARKASLENDVVVGWEQ